MISLSYSFDQEWLVIGLSLIAVIFSHSVLHASCTIKLNKCDCWPGHVMEILGPAQGSTSSHILTVVMVKLCDTSWFCATSRGMVLQRRLAVFAKQAWVLAAST